jgi:hypothetical protein
MRLGQLVLETGVSKSGFFQLLSVPLGAYVVQAICPGFAPSQKLRIETREGLESVLTEPLAVALPTSLAISFSPPNAIFGGNWHLRLARGSLESGFRDTADGEVDETGYWEKANLRPGEYVAILEAPSPSGNRSSRWLVEELVLEAGENLRHFEVPLIPIKGTVRHGDEYMAARLWLGGGTNYMVQFDSDQNGHFAGFLPSEGKYGVEIELPDGERERVLLKPIEIKLGSKPHANVMILVPATTIRGEVLDESGRPVEGAVVLARSHDTEMMRKESRLISGPEGSFRFRGLAPGDMSVQAQARGKESAWLRLSLEEDLEPPYVQLVVADNVRVQGYVTHRNGPVPGAQVFLYPGVVQSGAIGTIDSVVAGPDGGFSAQLPAYATELSLVVMAPGYALQMERRAIPKRGETVLVELANEGGEVKSQRFEGSPYEAVLVAENGSAVPLITLRRWMQLHNVKLGGEGAIVIPNVAPGLYALCPSLLAASEGKGCVDGYLAPRSQVLLSE